MKSDTTWATDAAEVAKYCSSIPIKEVLDDPKIHVSEYLPGSWCVLWAGNSYIDLGPVRNEDVAREAAAIYVSLRIWGVPIDFAQDRAHDFICHHHAMRRWLENRWELEAEIKALKARLTC